MKFVYQVAVTLVVELHDEKAPEGDELSRRITEQFTEILDQVKIHPKDCVLLETEEDE